ncbi:MAG: hypothetical protein R3304_01380 [Longimicrobiales bacterium]|nr:hypothetical protein [Longimicrobiales bacterium]
MGTYACAARRRRGSAREATRLLLAQALLAPALFPAVVQGQDRDPWPVDEQMVAKIREEGLQRSNLPNTLSYLTDVLGARLTNSRDMERAQRWVVGEMQEMGLSDVVREPFMEYGAAWDNEHVSLHMLAPDYTPLVGYPVAHTPGTGGRLRLEAVVGDVRTRADLARYRGSLRGKA